MTAERPPRDKLHKLEAVMADRAATDGEKAAARAAATRVRTKLSRQRAEDSRAAIEANPGLMYLLGRAWGRTRRRPDGDSARAEPGIMYSLGRAWRKMISKR